MQTRWIVFGPDAEGRECRMRGPHTFGPPLLSPYFPCLPSRPPSSPRYFPFYPILSQTAGASVPCFLFLRDVAYMPCRRLGNK